MIILFDGIYIYYIKVIMNTLEELHNIEITRDSSEEDAQTALALLNPVYSDDKYHLFVESLTQK